MLGPKSPQGDSKTNRSLFAQFADSLVTLSPTMLIKILGNPVAIFPYDHPAIVSMRLAFFMTWLLSVTDKGARAAKETEAYEEQYIRAQTGLGAAGASAH